MIWCYTTDPNTEWEYCYPIENPVKPEYKSELEVCQTEKCSEYRGIQDKTISGKTCQRWDSQTPH